ncbi:HET-domain-containing protein [Parathielavia hyrcaniae]|uniref:HET-domain-containing protein n=1 Tax=Parathielavia hyrcaniae TaxID=113614 RepID=A0AAN6Q1Z0_9PEZI|nr:HET-domain-containing protein [Parathielavia hyrcaniae]
MEAGQLRLCQTCTATLQGETFINERSDQYAVGDKHPRFNRVHHDNYISLTQSKDASCWICSLLWAKHTPPPSSGENRVGETSAHHDLRSFSRVDAYDGIDVYFHVRCTCKAEFDLHVSVSQATHANQGLDASYLVLQGCDEKRPSILGLSQDLSVIHSWIATCEASHEHCDTTTQARDPGFLPTRLIDVKDVKLGKARLRSRDDVQVREDGKYPPYWTLSHRWGDPESILQLREATEGHFQEGISLEELSRTFRDAVLLVHRLGYRYIWIDSLCVFQDSFADWQAEAGAMVDVYRHSFCNILAAGSSYDPSTTGLFTERTLSPRLLHPFTTDVSIVKIVTETQKETMPGPWTLSNESAWADEIESAPISKRGWVVQERFLATRVLHFTRNQIYWECLERSHSATEPTHDLSTGRRGRSKATAYKTSRIGLARTRAELDAAPAGQPPPWSEDSHHPNPASSSFHAHWGPIVGIYANCALTKESDRFPAMSGIAKAFQQVSGDVYLAGLWKRLLWTDLPWQSLASAGVPACRSSEAYAPSWSWASVVGGDVRLGIAHTKFGSLPTRLIRLVEARVVPEPPAAGGDVTGMLRSAELDVECMMYYYRWDGGRRRLEVFEDEARTEVFFWQTGDDDGGGTLDLHLDTSELVAQFAAAGQIDGVCVPVSGAYHGYGGGKNEYLVLEHESGSRFRRIGLLRAGEIGKWIQGWSESRSSVITLV